MPPIRASPTFGYNSSQPLLTQAMNIARVPATNRTALLAELRNNTSIYSTQDPEPLILALMVNSN